MADSKARQPYIPVDHLMGGYYQIYRRLFFIFGVVIVGMLASYFGAPNWLAIICAGISVGPLFTLEQIYAKFRFEKDQSS